MEDLLKAKKVIYMDVGQIYVFEGDDLRKKKRYKRHICLNINPTAYCLNIDYYNGFVKDGLYVKGKEQN